MDQAKLENLLILMKSLFGNDHLTVADLARRMKSSQRTIRRYLDTFRAAGFSISKVSPGVYRLDTLGGNYVNLSKVVMFTDEEAFVVNDLISTLANGTPMKEALSKKLSSVYRSTNIAQFVTNKSTGKFVDLLLEAMNNKKIVVLHDYESGHSDSVSDRRVEPFKFTTNLTEILAYEAETDAVKAFKLSRIGSVEILPDNWEHADKHLSREQDVFRMSGEELTSVTLELSVLAKSLLIEEYPMAAKDIHKTSTGKWILKTNVRSMAGVGRFVMGLCREVKIVRSPELREYIRSLIPEVEKLAKN